MKKLLAVTLLLIGLTSIATAQTTVTTITGKVIMADDGLPVIGATVMLNAKDSLNLSKPGRVVVTDIDGIFTIKSRAKESDITITYLGCKDYFTQIEKGKTNVNLGTIKLETSSVIMDAAVVTADGKISQVKGDTVQFNASSFKTNPDATAEDLVKKMPGVTVDSDGAINAQGEKITKVLVNGKEYFDSDPSAALKNLPSDAVESVQVFDGQSDQAKFSGMDDGERIKTVNIVTKSGVMNSVYGKAWLGYGTDTRYSTGLNLNFGNENHRFGIIAGSNNVNNTGFSFDDSGSSMRGGRGMMRAEGVSTGSFQTSARGGINQNSNLGLNYNGTFADKVKLTLAYRFSNVNAWQSTFNTSDMVSSARPYYNTTANEATSFDNNHNFTSRLELTPDTKNRINFNTNITYALNRGISASENIRFTEENGSITSASKSNYLRRLESYNLNGDLWWQHALGKAGRTLSLGTMVSANKGMGDNEQQSLYGLLAANNALDTSYINRIGMLSMSGYSFTGSMTYNEPIGKYSKIALNYNINYNRTIADQQGRNWDELTQKYSMIDTSTTNYLNRNYTTHTVGLAYNYTKGRNITLNIGLDYLMASQNNEQFRPSIGDNSTKFSFQSLQPSIRLRLTPSKGQSINLDLRRFSSFPSITQLQDVLDVTDPINVSKGNPDLAQSYSTVFRARYNISTENNTNLNIMLMGNLRENSIVNNRILLDRDTVVNGTTIYKNSTYSTYTNMNGAMTLMGIATYTFPLKFIKSNFATTVHYRYITQPSMQDGVENLNRSNYVNLDFALNSNISSKIDFRIAYSPSLSLSSNSVGSNLFNRYLTHKVSGFANIYLTPNLYVNADGSWNNTYGTAENSSQHYFIVNAAVGYKFLKNKQAEFKLQAYDLLNQNRSFTQSVDANGNIITNLNYSLLKQYFMLSFTYKFDTRKSGSRNSKSNSYGGPNFEGRPPMPGGGIH